MQIFKAETQTVESSLLDVMCVVRRRKWRVNWENRKEPVISYVRAFD